MRERLGAFGVSHIPCIFPVQWGATELLGVSQPSNCFVRFVSDSYEIEYDLMGFIGFDMGLSMRT